MKVVMWGIRRGEHDKYGQPEYTVDDQVGMGRLFRDDSDELKKFVADEVKKSNRKVEYFTQECAARYDDFYSSSVYRQMLLGLEGKELVVYDEDNQAACGPENRRKGTLAGRLWLRSI